jgi:hypothetical protein
MKKRIYIYAAFLQNCKTHVNDLNTGYFVARNLAEAMDKAETYFSKFRPVNEGWTKPQMVWNDVPESKVNELANQEESRFLSVSA